MRVWQAHERAVLAVAFTGGGVLATASRWRPGRAVWDQATGDQQRASTLFLEPVVAFAFAPDGQTLAVARRGAGVGAPGIW